MIFSSFASGDDSSKYPKGIRIALDYLKCTDFESMEPGTYPIDGDDIYAEVKDLDTAPAEERKMETHKRYIDVQYVVTGKEKMGFLFVQRLRSGGWRP